MSHTLLKRIDQAVVAGGVAAALVILACWWVAKGGPSGRLINIEHAEPLSYEFLVDLNQAGWPELAQLPEVGEVLSRRIVASRKTAGPYSKPEDLLRVKGIGPRRLARIRNYLLPLPGEEVLVSKP